MSDRKRTDICGVGSVMETYKLVLLTLITLLLFYIAFLVSDLVF